MTEPYDAEPRPLEKATNGFILCPHCEQVVQLPHGCAEDIDPGESRTPTSAAYRQGVIAGVFHRAERAESLLMGMAFDHFAENGGHPCFPWAAGKCAICSLVEAAR